MSVNTCGQNKQRNQAYINSSKWYKATEQQGSMKDELAEPTGLHGWQEYTPTSSIEKAGSGTSGRHHPSRRLQRVASLCQSALPLFLPLPTHIPWHIFSPYHSFLLTILPTGVSFLRPLKGKSDTIRIKSLLVTSYPKEICAKQKTSEHQIPHL